MELAKHPLNGREIKNALRLALALASEEDRPLDHELFMETSSMVEPISSFGKSNNGVDNLTVQVLNPEPSFLWRYFMPALPFLFLLLLNGVLLMTVFRNGGDDGAKDSDNLVESHKFFNRFRI
jgi:hypothetical protein